MQTINRIGSAESDSLDTVRLEALIETRFLELRARMEENHGKLWREISDFRTTSFCFGVVFAGVAIIVLKFVVPLLR
jgi:hypothetical protein